MNDKFIGQFKQSNYKILKTYIDTQERNVRLYHTKYTPENPTKTICIIHGFGQHSGRFYPIADFFAKKNFEVLLVDLRGFGYSGAPRGCATVQKLQNDVILLLKQAREDLPLFFYAHSLGALVTTKLLIQRSELNVSGCIFTSPLFGFPKDRKLPWIKTFMVKQIGGGLDDIIINSMVNPTALTKNNHFIRTIFEDRLMIPFLSVNMAKSIFESIQFFNQKFNQFRYPVIVFHGKQDSVTNYQDSKRFVYERVTAYKKLHLFENGYHQLQHDIQKQQLLQKSSAFVQQIPLRMCRPFGKINISNIDTRPKANNLLRNVLIIVIACFILLKLLKRKTQTTDISLISKIIGLLKGGK